MAALYFKMGVKEGASKIVLRLGEREFGVGVQRTDPDRLVQPMGFR